MVLYNQELHKLAVISYDIFLAPTNHNKDWNYDETCSCNSCSKRGECVWQPSSWIIFELKRKTLVTKVEAFFLLFVFGVICWHKCISVHFKDVLSRDYIVDRNFWFVSVTQVPPCVAMMRFLMALCSTPPLHCIFNKQWDFWQSGMKTHFQT